MNNNALPVTVDGRPITDRLLYRGMRVNILAGAIGMAWVGMSQGMILTLFIDALGAKGVMIGLAATLMQFALIMQIPGAFLSERLVRRKALWASIVLASRCLWFIPPLVLWLMPARPHVVAAVTVWLVAISAFMGQSMAAPWFGWMADLIPERMRGRFWGTRQGWVTAAMLLGMGVSGYLLDILPPPRDGGTWNGFLILFVVGAVLGCLDILVHLAVPEPRAQVMPPTPWLNRIREPLRDADLRRLTFSMGAYMFAGGLASLGIIYLKKDFAFTYSHIAATAIAATVGTMVSSFAWGWVTDRIGGRAFGAIMLVLLPIPSMAWFFMRDYPTDLIGLFERIRGLGPVVSGVVYVLPDAWVTWMRALVLPQAVWLMIVAGFFAGALYGGVGICQINLSAALAPRQGRTMAMAVHWALMGAIAALGPLIGGQVMDFFVENPIHYLLPTGPKLNAQHLLIIVHALIFWCVSLPLLLRIRRRVNEPQFITAFSQVVFNNPFRMFANIYAAGGAATSRQRAQALQRLGQRRTELAVMDLIETLDDPAGEVREEAALALGNIGSPQAVSALIRHLEDPASDLAVAAARGLRLAHNPASLEALLRRLDDPNPELKAECAEALAAIGDLRAVHPLMEQLNEAGGDVRVTLAVAEALGHLREVSAVYHLVATARRTDNPRIRRVLSLAVAELLGEPHAFYRVMRREADSRCSQVPTLVRQLRRETRRVLRRAGQEPRRILLDKTGELYRAFDGGDADAVSAILYQVACGLARVRFGVEPGDHVDAFVAELFGRDKLFATGVWYLNTLREPWRIHEADGRGHTDLLVGLHFLAGMRWD